MFGLFATEWVSGVVRRHQRHEKARDDDVDEIIATIDAVRTLADEYWSTSPSELGARESILDGRIVGGLHHINLLIAGLFTGPAKRECDVAAFRFSDASASGDFGDPDRQAEPARLSSVHSAALTLKHLVRTQRRKLKYKTLA
tara:strand:- start:16543 stop:16971 length:429 start_codon:yes stop_codon:yes gene_type:complete